MQPSMINCDNPRADGAVCGENALIYRIHYVLVKEEAIGQDEPTHVLKETRYQISCPRCGRRTQTEKHD
jgi:hypothetical protein